MFKLNEISIGGVLVVCTILAVLLYIYCGSHENNLDKYLSVLDLNKDGKVSRWELKHYLKLVKAENERRKTDWNSIKKQVVGGLFRGFLMGIILSDLEGGIALGLVLGAINPVLHTAEKSIYY